MTRRTNHAHADDVRPPRREEQLAGTMFDPAPPAPEPPVRRVPVAAHMRTLDGPPAKSGEARKLEVLTDHEAQQAKRAAIVHVRAQLLVRYRVRAAVNAETAEVDADDVDEILRTWPNFEPTLRDGNQNWRGAIWGKAFKRTGRWSPSKRPEMNGHLNPGWRPVL